jgi:hypothetical protein
VASIWRQIGKKNMSEKDKDLQGGRDPHLDIPSEANRDKHINFREAEEGNNREERRNDKDVEERRKQWRKGLEEGEKARREGQQDN